jgi:hypothetical protein
MGNKAPLPSGGQTIPTPISESPLIRPGDPGSNLPTAPPDQGGNIRSTLMKVLGGIAGAGGTQQQQPPAPPIPQTVPFMQPPMVQAPEQLQQQKNYTPYTRRKY